MKYILYRSLGSIDKDVKKHEIVGVEFGDSIDDVADDLIRDAADDLAALPEYAAGSLLCNCGNQAENHRSGRAILYKTALSLLCCKSLGDGPPVCQSHLPDTTARINPAVSPCTKGIKRPKAHRTFGLFCY